MAYQDSPRPSAADRDRAVRATTSDRGGAAAGRPARVWHVSTDLDTRGGVSSYVRALASTPLWPRWSVRHIVTHRDGSGRDKIDAFARGLARYGWALVWEKPDLVHLHMGIGASFARKTIMFWMARARGVPAILHIHGAEFDAFHDRSPYLVRVLVRITLNAAVAVVALGATWARRLQKIAPDAQVIAVPNAVRTAAAAPAPGDGPVRALFLGEIGERKGAFALIEAWSRAAPIGRAVLLMAGDRGTERARRAVADAGLADTVTVRSWMSADEVQDELARSHVLVLPSRHEGQPMAVLEAMAHGLCVVATAVGGIPDLVEHGRSGLLVPPDDLEALTGSLHQVLVDEELRARLAAGAHARAAAEFDIGVIWRRYDDLYTGAVRAGAVPSGTIAP